MIVAVIILALALVVCAAFVVLLKRDICLLNRTLKTIEKYDTNMRATTGTFDKNICELCSTVNGILDKQKKIAVANEKSNREFRQAITNISHDLRTPLTSAIGYIQMLRSDKTPDGKKHEYLNIIEQRMKSLANLMNGLFEYAQIVEGKTVQNIEKVNICNVLRDIMSSFYEDFISKNFNVQIDIPDAPVYVLCDADSLKRVTQNLIQNVFAHGTEQFSLIVDGEHTAVTFKNKVPEIGSLEIDRLFERFYTADLSRSSNTAGLGLAIAKELIQNMGGEISACIENDLLRIVFSLPKLV